MTNLSNYAEILLTNWLMDDVATTRPTAWHVLNCIAMTAGRRMLEQSVALYVSQK